MAILAETVDFRFEPPPPWDSHHRWPGGRNHVVEYRAAATVVLGDNDWIMLKIRIPKDEVWRPVYMRVASAELLNRFVIGTYDTQAGIATWDRSWIWNDNLNYVKLMDNSGWSNLFREYWYRDAVGSDWPEADVWQPDQDIDLLLYADGLLWVVGTTVGVRLRVIRTKIFVGEGPVPADWSAHNNAALNTMADRGS